MNTFTIQIEADGKVSVDSEGWSDTKHVDADDLLSELEDLLGGNITRNKREPAFVKAFFKNRIVQRGGKIVKA